MLLVTVLTSGVLGGQYLSKVGALLWKNDVQKFPPEIQGVVSLNSRSFIPPLLTVQFINQTLF